MTGAQIVAARALLGWTQFDLAKRAGVSRRTVTYMENEQRPYSDQSFYDILRTLENAGVTFITNDEVVGVTCRLYTGSRVLP